MAVIDIIGDSLIFLCIKFAISLFGVLAFVNLTRQEFLITGEDENLLSSHNAVSLGPPTKDIYLGIAASLMALPSESDRTLWAESTRVRDCHMSI